MAYDEELADRVRDALSGEAGISERKMFGGLGFMADGHIAVAASSNGDLLVRVDPQRAQDWVDDDTVHVMEMGGRRMRGWLLVAIGTVASDAALTTWVGRALSHARSLPAKSD